MAKPSWFKPRRYRHFDVPIVSEWATTLTPEQVVAHPWSPLLHWIKETPRYRPLDGKTVVKERDIMHASHRDACILSKYSHELTGRLDAWYALNGLHEAVIAYRSLRKSNYHFAATAQAYVRNHDSVEAMCFDVTGFFDNIDHKRLKQRLKWLLAVDELPDDWHRVLRSVTRYSHVRKADLKAHPVFGLRLKQRGADRPIATVKELKAGGIRIHTNGKGIGVPQGTPISASLSNLYMADFDLAMKALADQHGALYQRYSDDILIICAPEHADQLAAAVSDALNNEALELQNDKTIRQRFTGDERDNFQYLGFQLGLGPALVRPGSLSRQWRSAKRAIRRSERKAERLAKAGQKDKIYTSKMRGRLTHVGLRNFLAYADRSSDELQSQSINRQVKALRKFALRGLARVKAIKNS
ncbi:reverse transcriptase domain-containing protein [Novosphingobium sp. KN65.2]|uniref:reverse transcriptase domain-containing protein n=1 Tax=Novosphingobium sp. KN65.2 TaxID=1478134 RepID=UPI0005E05841|nr:reverse transcriptase domain-containing protein [Novosphingobium sp. KN65.2]CDO36125.1 putative Reverse transcriptase [Novosphingobium sp. KN65.2]